jgi:hypothetical protein
VNSQFVFEFDCGYAGDCPQGFDTLGRYRAGKHTHTRQSRVCPEPECATGYGHLVHALEGIVRDGNRHANSGHAQGA